MEHTNETAVCEVCGGEAPAIGWDCYDCALRASEAARAPLTAELDAAVFYFGDDEGELYLAGIRS